MRAYTMNHMSTDAINELNDREREQRHHREHHDEWQFALSLAFALGLLAGALVTL